MNHNDILGVTMAGLEAGFKVLHIAAFDLKFTAPDSDVSKVLSDAALKDFDSIPVKDGGRVVGVLERKAISTTGRVNGQMRQLNDSILVSADEPLIRFLPTLAQSPYRLVVQGTKICGIVTLSDVAKLPVRLMAFTLVIHLEALLANVIRKECSRDEDWLPHLGAQRTKLEKRLERRRKQNIHLLSPIEVADLTHKITVVGKIRKLPDFDDELRPIVELRNSLAHDGDFVKECNGVTGLLERLDQLERLIGRFNTMPRVRTTKVTEARADA